MFENYLTNPSEALLHFSGHDPWTLQDAFMGCLILGGTGSGKSSASGRAIALSLLRGGFGGLVLCAKPDEAERWRWYARQAGRSKSLIVLDGKNGRCFNFLEYELARTDAGRSTSNAVAALISILDVMQRAGGGGGSGGGDNPFWRESVRVLLSHAMDALWWAYGRVSLPELMRFVSSAPRGAKDLVDEAFQKNSFAFKTLETAATAPRHEPDQDDLITVLEYFNSEQFGTLDSKTRSNIIGTLTSMVSDFLKGDLRKMLCTGTTTVPELSEQGAVIVLDLPLKTWERGGILAQQIFKFAWQRAIERRKVTAKTRPVFLWVDECQLFLSDYDNEFQSTARSSRVCSVALTQSIPAMVKAAGGSHTQEMVDAYMTNFQTKIIHACQDERTMNWAAGMVGKGIQYRQSWNEGSNQSNSRSESEGWNSSEGRNSGHTYNPSPYNSPFLSGSGSSNQGKSVQQGESATYGNSNTAGSSEGQSVQEVMDYYVQPSVFGSGLRTGGGRNKGLVDGIVLQGGRTWSYTGTPWMQCVFQSVYR